MDAADERGTSIPEAPSAARSESVHRAATGTYLLGVACIVAGGLIAAISSPLRLPLGPWAAAYLVLVAGCAQCALAVARDRLTLPPRSPRGFVLQFGCWNLGNAAVLIGALSAVPAVVDVGGALLVVTLAVELWQSRAPERARRWWVWAYRAVLLVLLVSIPIGLVLAAVRGGAGA